MTMIWAVNVIFKGDHFKKISKENNILVGIIRASPTFEDSEADTSGGSSFNTVRHKGQAQSTVQLVSNPLS